MKKILPKFIIKRPVFDWLLQSGGWSSKEISEVLFTKRIEREKFLTDINAGRDIILSLKKSEILAKLLKRPLSVLFISEPPDEPPLFRDFRG